MFLCASGTWLFFEYSKGLCRKSVADITSAWLLLAFFFFHFEFRTHKANCGISVNMVYHTNVAMELQAGVWQRLNANLICVVGP